MHIHVASSDGEAKFWLGPRVELARNYRLSRRDLRTVRSLIIENDERIRIAWREHFGT